MRALVESARRPGANKQPVRTVVIGDLNGADDALIDILRGTRLISSDHRWIGGCTELVQMGDVLNRGHGARKALELLFALRGPATRAGGRVVMLLGNHEAMTMLGNEAYCSEGEYLSFATRSERLAWPGRVQRVTRRIYKSGVRGGGWRRFRKGWRYGECSTCQVVHRCDARWGPTDDSVERCVRCPSFTRAEAWCSFTGAAPRWAELGADGVNHAARVELADVRRRFLQFPKSSIFRSPEGPLWDRSLSAGGADASKNLKASLRLLGAERMIVGHTPTSYVRGGRAGCILTRHGGRLVLVDVGLDHGDNAPRAALLIEGGRGIEWSKEGTRTLWDEGCVVER